MIIDLTLDVTPEIREGARKNLGRVVYGHLGTHFDVMDKAFPLEYSERPGIVFDVPSGPGTEISLDDVDMELVSEGMFVAFRTAYMDIEPYGTKVYFKDHPQLSRDLIGAVVAKRVAIIAVDCAGVRSGREHTEMDQFCAERGVFVVENLCALDQVLKGEKTATFDASIYPMKFSGMTGLPCRVIARI